MPHPSTTRGNTWRAVLAVALLNALLAFPVLYQIYKHYNAEIAPMDVRTYMEMVDGGVEAVHAPFRYRILTPLAVRALAPLPGYPVDIDYTGDPGEARTFFHFLLVNFAFAVLTSALLFAWLRRTVAPPWALVASLFYLFGFYSLTAGLLPMTDAACHLAIIAALLCLDRNRPVAFLAVALAGVFAKETVPLVLGLWIVATAVGDRRRLWWLALLAPAAAAYIALTRLYPVPPSHAFYDPVFVLKGLLRAFSPATWDRSFLFHAVLGHLPFLAALCAVLWLRLRGTRVRLDPCLWVVAALLVLGMAMGIGNNAARLAFMAFPAMALVQARVLEALAGGSATG